MGSFSEVVLSSDLRADTPPDVLAAFSRARAGEDGPRLPEPWPTDLDWEFDGDEEDDEEPWRHDWSEPLACDMSGVIWPGPTHCTLIWDDAVGRWWLSSRGVWKTGPGGVPVILGWLGRYLGADASPSNVMVVGSVRYEYVEKTFPICSDGQQLFVPGLDDVDW